MHTRLSARLRLISAAVMATAGLLLLLRPGTADAQGSGFYQQTNLVSDIAGMARFTDKRLVNSWGLSHSGTGPWQVSDNGTGLSTRYMGNGKAVQPKVTIPPPGGSPPRTTAAPTGNVFNDTGDFVVTKGPKSGPSQFVFATEDGTISGWNPDVDMTHAILEVDRSTVSQSGFVGAVYKGLATGTSHGDNFLYATNFRFGTVEQFDADFKLVKSFTDSTLANTCPKPGQCFAPFGIQNIVVNGSQRLFVTFALQNAEHHDDVASAGNGFVDVFDTNGTLIGSQPLVSHGTLNSPWGLALAPATFGQFGGDLLIGNFGDGLINAFNFRTGVIDQLKDVNGVSIKINGLWGLAFGNDAMAGPSTTLFFASGLNDEADGLFGSITPA